MDDLIILMEGTVEPQTNRLLPQGKLTNRKAVEDLVRKGDRIGAMKEYMRQTRAGLKEAKDAVDAVMREMRKQ